MQGLQIGGTSLPSAKILVFGCPTKTGQRFDVKRSVGWIGIRLHTKRMSGIRPLAQSGLQEGSP
jgi:hypothetical protein